VVNYASPVTLDSTAQAKLDSTAQATRQAKMVRSIFEGHPPVVQLELEAMPDSLHFVKVENRPSWLARLFGAKPSTAIYLGQPTVTAGKKSTVTINHVQGNQTNTSTAKNGRTVVGDGASNIESGKKSGPISQAAPGATATTNVASTKKGNSQAGEGNVAPTTTKEAGWPWWLYLLLVAGVLFGIYKFSKRFTPI
jgi:hypothetical protein